LRPEVIRAVQGVERIIHAGDVGKEDVLDRLGALAPVTVVRGNVDVGAWALRLPDTATLEIEHVTLYVLHDLGGLRLVPEAAGFKVVAYGHSHQPSIHERNGVLYVNPGSAGPRRFRSPVSVAFLYVEGGSVEAELLMLDA
jgi:putative phosphoesterase